MKRRRLDRLLLERGLAQSREQAQRLIMAGEVSVNDQVPLKPSTAVIGNEDISVRSRPPFVSRAGVKLAAALGQFNIPVNGLVALDVGASTGGFTDCLLQLGALRVYAVDVGYGQLAWKLRQDRRVIVMERVNARYLTSLPEAIDIATFDVSFISLDKVVTPVVKLLKPQASIVALVKPQFEAGRGQVGRGGVVRDREVHRDVLLRFITWARNQGLSFQGLMVCPILGPAGNVEFPVYLGRGIRDPELCVDELVEACLSQVHGSL